MTRKARGRESERLLAQYLNAEGFIAFPANPSASGSDVVGVEGIDWEIKSRRNLDIPALFKQLERRRKSTGLGLGVIRLNGQGAKNIGSWVGLVRLDDLVYLLKAAGYGKR